VKLRRSNLDLYVTGNTAYCVKLSGKDIRVIRMKLNQLV